jgi:hypothetical protein
MLRILVAAALVAATVLPATVLPATALDRRMTVVNQTGVTMNNFYATNTGNDSWGKDWLGSQVMPSGSQIQVNFDDSSGYCMFDFRAIFADGDELVSQVNVCEIGTYTYE